jgi:GTP cyclohydrolase IA
MTTTAEVNPKPLVIDPIKLQEALKSQSRNVAARPTPNDIMDIIKEAEIPNSAAVQVYPGQEAPSDDPNAMIESAYEDIILALQNIGYNRPKDVENFDGTPARAMRALTELVQPMDAIHKEISHHIRKTFPGPDGMVLCKNVLVFGVCPHHILPVIMRVSVGYVPAVEGKVIGISKLACIAGLLGHRPVLQEQYTSDLTSVFFKDEKETEKEFPWPQLVTRGAAVYVEALHMCMACRGARRYEAQLVTSCVKGAFKTQPETRSEFMNIVTRRTSELIGA